MGAVPVRSDQNCEYLSLSAWSSSTTSVRAPAALRALAMPARAISRSEVSHFIVLAMEWTEEAIGTLRVVSL